MKRIELVVENRTEEELSHSPNKLRHTGWVPGVLYGHGKPATIKVELKHFSKAIHTDAGLNALFNVKLDGKTALGIIKELQRDVFTQEPIHVDLMRINVKEKIEVKIPVHTKGEAKGVRENQGILEHLQRDVTLRCLPDQIPPHVDIDVTDLDIHGTVSVSDLKFDAGIEVITPGDKVIVNVVPPRIEEEPAPVAPIEGEAAAQPEVIGKGKEEGEEAAGTGKPAAGAKTEAKKEEKK